MIRKKLERPSEEKRETQDERAGRFSLARIKGLFSDKLVKNIGWQSASQILIRVLRLATVVVLSRTLTEEDYGIIAILFTVTDFANIFLRKGGIAPKLIQADESDVMTLARTAYWVNWILCLSIFATQALLAFPIAAFYDNSKLVLPIVVSGVSYCLNPIFAVQDALIRRENRLKVSAIGSVAYAATSQVFIFAFALMGWGFWSVVIAQIIGNCTWPFVFLSNHSWRPSGSFTVYRWKDIFNFSKFPIGIEMLNHLRSNIDYLLIGKFFTVEQLGTYFFAFNAGLGISLNAINMVTNSVFPYLCEVRTDPEKLKKAYRRSLKVVAMIMLPLVLSQTSLAPFYVPIVFDEKWVPAIPILMMVCLSGIPRAFGLVSEQLLLAVDRGRDGLVWNVIFTLVFIGALLVAVQYNIYVVAAVVLAVHVIALPGFSIWVARSIFGKGRLMSS